MLANILEPVEPESNVTANVNAPRELAEMHDFSLGSTQGQISSPSPRANRLWVFIRELVVGVARALTNAKNASCCPLEAFYFLACPWPGTSSVGR